MNKQKNYTKNEDCEKWSSDATLYKIMSAQSFDRRSFDPVKEKLIDFKKRLEKSE